jgi:hypothetical protein
LPAASAPETFEISGSDSYLVFLAMDYYRDNINKFEVKKGSKSYLEGLMAEVLDDGLELVVSEEIDGVSSGVESLLEVWLE